MSDTPLGEPDHDCLFDVASSQYGFFTRAQAEGCGIRDHLLAHHARSGRYIRISRGLYRLKAFPSSPRDELVAAWLAVGKDIAVVSHESALDLFDLSDVIPDEIHLTVARSKRSLRRTPGVRIHTTARPLESTDTTVHKGIRVTSAARTIVDVADTGGGPEQVELAIRQAIRRGLTTRDRLEQTANGRNRRVTDLVGKVLGEMFREV